MTIGSPPVRLLMAVLSLPSLNMKCGEPPLGWLAPQAMLPLSMKHTPPIMRFSSRPALWPMHLRNRLVSSSS